MTDRPEYIRCIRQTHAEHSDKSWCGRLLSDEWVFENIDHATYNRGRLLPCPECAMAIIKRLTEAIGQFAELKDFNEVTVPYHSPTNQQVLD